MSEVKKGISFASSSAIRERMQQQVRRDTKPELAFRRDLHRLGFRFSVDRRPVPKIRRRADVVFRSARVAVFIDGCFWHGCPQHGTWPKANAVWWRAKIEKNRLRDQDTDKRLMHQGWAVVRVWAHDDPQRSACRVAKLVRRRSRKALT